MGTIYRVDVLWFVCLRTATEDRRYTQRRRCKGLAHIGILKAIDSAGLDVSYVTGTSMGPSSGHCMRVVTAQIR